MNLIFLVKDTLLVGSVVEAGKIHVQVASLTDSTSSFVVGQEGGQAVVGRVAVLQAGGDGDVWTKSSSTRRIFNSLYLTIPPALLPPPGSEAALRVTPQLESLLVLT